MAHSQSLLCCPPGQMNPLHRTRTSILRPSELVEIQGSYWPRISVVSELKRKKQSKEPVTKASRRVKKKMELIRQLKHVKSTSLPIEQPISPSLEASSLSIAFDQNTSPCWEPSSLKTSRKTSSFTGRPFFPQVDNTTKEVRPSLCGLKGPRRKKSLKGVVAPR